MQEPQIHSLPDFELQNCNMIELGLIATITTGCQYSQYEWPAEDLNPFTIVESFDDHVIILSDTRYMRVSERERNKYSFKKGDIIFKHNTSSPQLGKCVLFDLNDLVLHTKYLRIRPDQGINSLFVMGVLGSLRSKGKLHALAVVRQNISSIRIDDLKRLKIPFPSIEDQSKKVYTENPQL